MGVVIAIVWIGGLALILAAITSARTRARVAVNARVHTSMEVSSTKGAEALGSLVAQSLQDAGLHETGSFDGTRFFRLDRVTQLELRVWSTDDGAQARVVLPKVRSTSGRPQKLGAVGSALRSAERSLRRLDPQAQIG